MQHKISLLGDEDTTVLSASHQPQHWRKQGRVEEREGGREEGSVGGSEGEWKGRREEGRMGGRIGERQGGRRMECMDVIAE